MKSTYNRKTRAKEIFDKVVCNVRNIIQNGEYEKYLNGDMDKLYDNLKIKLDNKTISKDEYKQMQKIENVKANISKVTNILELRDHLQDKLNKLKDEKKKIETLEAQEKNIEKADKEAKTLLEELNKIIGEKEKIQKNLR